MTMSELAATTGMTKQQMTKIVNRLIEHNFVERVSDPDDRRIIRLKIKDKAESYINRFLDRDAAYFKEFFDEFAPSDRDELAQALATLLRIFKSLPHNDIGGRITEAKCGKSHHGHLRKGGGEPRKEDDI